MPIRITKPATALFASLAVFSVTLVVGCGPDKTDAAVELSADDPYLVEPAEVTEYVPQDNGGEDAFNAE